MCPDIMDILLLLFTLLVLYVKPTNASVCSVTPVELLATKERKLLTSPGYPDEYERALLCRWIIRAQSEDMVIRLDVKDTSMEPSTGCSDDFVQVHDGPSRVYKGLYRWCGNRIPPSLLPTRNAVLTVFKTDMFDCRRGFAMEYWSEHQDIKKQRMTLTRIHRDLQIASIVLAGFVFVAAVALISAKKMKTILTCCKDNIRVQDKPCGQATQAVNSKIITEEVGQAQINNFHAVVMLAAGKENGDAHEKEECDRGNEQSESADSAPVKTYSGRKGTYLLYGNQECITSKKSFDSVQHTTYFPKEIGSAIISSDTYNTSHVVDHVVDQNQPRDLEQLNSAAFTNGDQSYGSLMSGLEFNSNSRKLSAETENSVASSSTGSRTTVFITSARDLHVRNSFAE